MMKRLARNPEKFEPFELYTTLGRIHNYQLGNPAHNKAFLERIDASLKSSQSDQQLIHGKRMEILFGLMAAGFGVCKLVKVEDSGEIFSAEEVAVPDYLLILEDGTKIFVEVKNCNIKDIHKPYILKKTYTSKVEKYAELHGIPVYYAIHYRNMNNKWTLQPLTSFVEKEDHYSTNIIRSLATNEMHLIGDIYIGTKPSLALELIADIDESTPALNNSEGYFSPKGYKIYCSGNEINDETERKIANYLMMYGDWSESEPEAIVDEDGKMQSISITLSPEIPENFERNGFDFIGVLSTMITKEFNIQTIQGKKVTAMDTNLEPHDFSVKIPSDYKGGSLPLWRISMLPNLDYKESPDEGFYYEVTTDGE